ncbi:MAG TPA: hypothetical protein VGD26_01670 [Chitinophagaceae bacterium]
MRVLPLDLGSVRVLAAPVGTVYFGVLRRAKNTYTWAGTGNDVGVAGCRDTLCFRMLNAKRNNTLFIKQKPKRAAICVVVNEPIEQILELIHYVEDKLKIPTKTRFYKTKHPDYYVVLIDGIWVERAYLLSLWGLIIRIGTRFKRSTAFTVTPEEFLAIYKSDYWNYPSVQRNYKALVEKGIIITPTEQGYNYGIAAVQLDI